MDEFKNEADKRSRHMGMGTEVKKEEEEEEEEMKKKRRLLNKETIQWRLAGLHSWTDRV